MQEEVAEAFVKNFQLSADEITALNGSSRDSPITKDFFTALEKTQKIRNNTKLLLQVCMMVVICLNIKKFHYVELSKTMNMNK